ncbi:hypothetical protein DPMN_076159 [Dreissena polymorpha]|uniref:Uncharacterized protein n=1 Tax=Dreissena polymorpha TaxID=45954 RepID=A0A9D4BND9_DREPO|nr:hypothetical protein DPMN_076159 [Dreissena polymorpha]
MPLSIFGLRQDGQTERRMDRFLLRLHYIREEPKAVERNLKAVKRNLKAVERNFKAVERNLKAVERNLKAIRVGRIPDNTKLSAP